MRVDAPLVRIFQKPVLNMVYAAIETDKRECMGDIFGRIPGGTRKDFLVNNAVTLGLLDCRSRGRAVQNKSAAARLGDLRGALPRAFPIIGYFHSHSQQKKTFQTGELPEMSNDDIATLDTIGYLGIIITIERSKKFLSWEARADGSIGGSLVGKNLSFYAYRLQKDGEERVPQKLRIVAPGALSVLNALPK